uniref:Enediyne biosynthetic pathway protein n=1 Tax=Dulem virus 37 TaxID=3145755 RepID=A0AAU8AY64_9CAUD
MRFPKRGGNWNNGTNAGVFYSNFNNARSNSDTNIGFRSAQPLRRPVRRSLKGERPRRNDLRSSCPSRKGKD